jgi:hypothetical protein
MRTTLDIEDDVLQAAKELARYEGSTAGKVISTLVRKALRSSSENAGTAFEYRNGVPVLPHRDGKIITMEHIQKIMDEEGI